MASAASRRVWVGIRLRSAPGPMARRLRKGVMPPLSASPPRAQAPGHLSPLRRAPGPHDRPAGGHVAMHDRARADDGLAPDPPALEDHRARAHMGARPDDGPAAEPGA